MLKQEEQFIQIDAKHYQNLLNRIKQLQHENNSLKKHFNERSTHNILQQFRQLETNSKCKICSKSTIHSDISQLNSIKQEWMLWSKKLNQKSVFHSKKHSKQYLTSDSQNIQKKIQQQLKQNQQLKLIESICLFGVKKSQLDRQQLQQNKAIQQNASLLYSCDQKYQCYADYFFPNKINLKKIREEKQQTQTNRIIFKKNTKRSQIALYIFQADQTHPILQPKYNEDKFVRTVNPAKKLYSFVVYFTDYFIFERMSSLRIPNQQQNQIETANLNLSDKSFNHPKKKLTNTLEFYLSKYCICLMTYFPLVNLMQNILIKIIDEIKIKRMQIFTDNPSQVDATYFITQLKEVADRIITQISKIPPNIDSVGDVLLGHQLCQINLSQSNIKKMTYNSWVNSCLKTFKKNIFYDLFINFLMQQSICFISEDLHTLTYIIFLFTDLLLRPFVYPHPCISVVFKQQLLGTPFIVTMGINKPTKWLQQNSDLISNNKIIVDLNKQCQIIGTPKNKPLRNEKLKKIINDYYKRMEIKVTLQSIFNKKQDKQMSQAEQNTNTINFIDSLKQFFNEQILTCLPAINSIERVKAYTKTDNTSHFTKEVIKTIEEHFHNNRKKDKDQLIQFFSEQQIFYMFLCDYYGLK